jgi:hypothetical protein
MRGGIDVVELLAMLAPPLTRPFGPPSPRERGEGKVRATIFTPS